MSMELFSMGNLLQYFPNRFLQVALCSSSQPGMRREGVKMGKIPSEHQIIFSCPFQMLRTPPGWLSLSCCLS